MSHMEDSKEDAKAELYKAIRYGKKSEFKDVVERLKGYLRADAGEKRIEKSKDYIIKLDGGV